MLESLFCRDVKVAETLDEAIGKIKSRKSRYSAVIDDLLDPVNGAWLGDAGHRVRRVMRTSPQARAAAGLRAKHAILDGLTTLEARHWHDGIGQCGG